MVVEFVVWMISVSELAHDFATDCAQSLSTAKVRILG